LRERVRQLELGQRPIVDERQLRVENPAGYVERNPRRAERTSGKVGWLDAN